VAAGPVEPEGGGELARVPEIAKTLAAIMAAGDADLLPTPEVAAEAVRWADAARAALTQLKAGTALINTAVIFKVRAACRLADLVDAGQEAGQIAGQGDRANVRPADVSTLAELGVDKRRLAEYRKVRDAYGRVDFTEWVRQTTDQDEVLSWDRLFRGGAHVGHNSGVSEWYTPAEYIAAAVEVLGAIDLDPASTAEANEVVDAAAFYTAEEDGLSRPWAGRVWLNPPYAQPAVARFANRLVAEYAAGNVTAAITLTNNATETGWWQTLASPAAALCFPLGRVRFWHPGKVSAPLQGQSVLYLGPYPGQFAEAFAAFGFAAVHRYG
jgi:hypothetical protein